MIECQFFYCLFSCWQVGTQFCIITKGDREFDGQLFFLFSAFDHRLCWLKILYTWGMYKIVVLATVCEYKTLLI